MASALPLLVLVVLLALAFDYINGFHDTANAIATVVSTRVLTPRTAILMAAVLNFLGAFFSENVAKTIAKGLVNPHDATQVVVLAAVIGAIAWNLITWYFGIPSSSSHPPAPERGARSASTTRPSWTRGWRSRHRATAPRRCSSSW